MRTRTALAASLSLALAAGSFAPAFSAPPKPKPIKKTWTATTTAADPVTPFAVTDVCEPEVPGAKHETPFTVPYAGVLTVKVHSFQGDWALGVLDKDGEMIASHDNDVTAGDALDAPSEVTIKFKKKTDIIVRACNFAGCPTATVDLSLVPKK